MKADEKKVKTEEKELITNPHVGSSLRSLFEELGEWEEVEALTQKKILAQQAKQKKKPA